MNHQTSIERLQAAGSQNTPAEGMSYDQIRELVNKALCDQAGADTWCYIVDCYPDKVVYELKEHYYERPYTVADGVVTLGEAIEVERQVSYIPMQAACEFIGAAADSNGTRWPVRVIAYGPDRQGRILWTKEPLVAALDLFEGAKVFACNDSQHKDPAKAARFGKSTRELVGALTQPEVRDDGIYAAFVILPSADWLSSDLKACESQQIDYVYGLSVDVSAKTKKITAAGKNMTVADVISKVEVDVVYDPIGGGKFMRAAAESGIKEEDNMKLIAKLLAALARGDQAEATRIQAALDAKSITEEQAADQIMAAMGKPPVTASPATEPLQAATSTELQEVRLLACGMVLDRELMNSKLPEPAQITLRSRFEGQIFEKQILQAAIRETKEMIDTLTASGSSQGAGDVRINVGRESSEKLQAAFDGMLGVQIAEDLRSVPVFTSIRAAYVEMTGDVDINGVLSPQLLRRMQAAYGDTTFAYALGNTLYRRLTQDYRGFSDYGVSRLVGNNIRNAIDFRPLESIRLGYYGDIPTLDTDIQDYPDLGEVSDEKVEYALKEKGGIITINRRTIINDDLRAIQKIVGRLPRAARRTVARTVWAPFIANATYKGDSKAIFHEDHGNLGSAAYSITAAEAARTAMFNQTEPDSLEKLGLRPATIAFPSALRGLVTNVNNFNPQAVAVENGNSMFGYFRPEGLFENPFQVDATDWYMFADPNEVEIVELAFLNGQQEPVMLVADNPTNGQMFVGGRIQYKIMHDHNAEPVDYRGAYKAVVAG